MITSTEKHKKIWELLKELMNKNTCLNDPVESLRYNGCDFTSKSDVANAFNNYFVNVGPNLANSLPNIIVNGSDQEIPSNLALMELKQITEEQMKKTIDKLKNKKAAPNGINNIMMKKIKTQVVPGFTKLGNLSFKEGTFPNECEIAKVKPIYKKEGDKTEPGNYRPISILSAPSRLMEMLMKEQLEIFLKQIRFLYEGQYGFRIDKDIQGAMFDLTTTVQNALDKNKKAGAIFIDLRKAFDTVNHEILMKKLYKIGI